MPRVHLTRRELVAAAGATAATGAVAAAVPDAWAKSLLSKRARVGPGAFLHGVASGEPTPTAVTFWSRLDTGRPRSGARLVVAKDAGMRKVVATTVVPTGAGLDGALKTRVGGLSPATEYFYAWESGTAVSPIGRTRTAPPPGSTAPVRVAYSSCQQYSLGHYGAHAHAAAQALDLYVFLGDYVYEQGIPPRQAIRPDGITAVDLATYRAKYGLYRSDPALQDLHRLHPIAHVWDDHEVANNYSNGFPTAAAQRAAAYRVAFEWLPRMTFPTDRHRIYKRISLGRTADLFLLDERQYRTGRNGDGQPRRLLGDAQMAWLIDELRRSPATWKLIGQQVLMAARIFGEESEDGDAWDGHAEDRARLLGAIEEAGIPNVVVLSGDAHVFMANFLHSDFDALGEDRVAPSAVEYVGGSVTSIGRNADEFEIQETAPWNKQYDGFRHGYAALDLRPEVLVTEYRETDRTIPNGPTTAFERFVQPTGANRFERQRL